MSLIPYVKAPAKVKKKKLTGRRKRAWVKREKRRLVQQVESANSSPYEGGCYARWGDCIWKVSADTIHTLNDASWSDEWDKKDKRRLPSEAKLDYPLYKDLVPWMDVAKEIRAWRNRIGKAGYLYVGGTLFGAQRKFRLTGVEVSNVDLVRGEIVHCDMELTFTEAKKSKAAKPPKRKRKTTSRKRTTAKKKATGKKTGGK